MATLGRRVFGAFSTTGTSDDIVVGNKGRILLNFSGIASVRVEEWSEQSKVFIPTGDVFTATGVYALNGGGQRLRLNCTSHTDNVDYEILK